MYNCTDCNVNCSKLSHWNRHLSTRKHIVRTTTIEKGLPNLSHKCKCGKIYKHSSSLWNHKKVCITIKQENNVNNKSSNVTTTIENDVLLELMKQNNEFKLLLVELSKTPTIINNITNNNNTNSTNNTNNTNNQFNLNVFLNEDCKNAMSINQFIDSIKLTVNDLEETGRLGFIDGLSRIFINALKELELTDRPIHCTDYKRETIYIKDENKWAKENDDKHTVVNVLRKIEKKNIGMLPKWINENPTCRIMDSPEAIQYYKIYKSALGDPSKEGIEKQDDKIIKNVLKEVVLDKSINK